MDRFLIAPCGVGVAAQRGQRQARFEAQTRVGGAQFDGLRVVCAGGFKPPAALTKPGERGQFIRPMDAVGQRLAITLLRLALAPRFFVHLTKPQPRQPEAGLDRQGASELPNGLVTATRFAKADRQVLPPPYVLRIQLEHPPECGCALLEPLFLR